MPRTTLKKVTKIPIKKTFVTEKKSVNTKIVEKKKLIKKTPLDVKILDNKGTVIETVTLPKDIFDAKINPVLVAQAVRVYQVNQRVFNASTKTRGDVEGSTKKVYKQKGTGNARHGSIRAPIYVGGGITFGPKPIQKRLYLPKKMKRQALYSVLTQQFKNNNIIIFHVINSDKLKTKSISSLINKQTQNQKSLFLFGKGEKNIYKSCVNISSLIAMPSTNINVYLVLKTQKIIFTKEGLSDFVQSQRKST